MATMSWRRLPGDMHDLLDRLDVERGEKEPAHGLLIRRSLNGHRVATRAYRDDPSPRLVPQGVSGDQWFHRMWSNRTRSRPRRWEPYVVRTAKVETVCGRVVAIGELSLDPEHRGRVATPAGSPLHVKQRGTGHGQPHGPLQRRPVSAVR